MPWPEHRGRVLVAGDGAGLLESWTREGVSFAPRSGRLTGGHASLIDRQWGRPATVDHGQRYRASIVHGLGDAWEVSCSTCSSGAPPGPRGCHTSPRPGGSSACSCAASHRSPRSSTHPDSLHAQRLRPLDQQSPSPADGRSPLFGGGKRYFPPLRTVSDLSRHANSSIAELVTSRERAAKAGRPRTASARREGTARNVSPSGPPSGTSAQPTGQRTIAGAPSLLSACPRPGYTLANTHRCAGVPRGSQRRWMDPSHRLGPRTRGPGTA
jgi:hypothetical protein